MTASDCEPGKSETDLPPRRDTLTIGRILLLTVGLAIGLGVFKPTADNDNNPWAFALSIDHAIAYYNAVLIGIALPAPLFIIGQRWRKGPRVGPGGLYAVTIGLGALLMLPPVSVEGEGGIAFACIHYTLPLVSLWYLTAALIAGSVGKELFARTTAWTERYGFFLAAFWTPVGVWWLISFYLEAFR